MYVLVYFYSSDIQNTIGETWQDFICGMLEDRAENDTGNPLICDGIQYGITSHSYRMMRATKRGAEQVRFLVVNNYKRWIDDVVAATSDSVVLTSLPSAFPVTSVVLSTTVLSGRFPFGLISVWSHTFFFFKAVRPHTGIRFFDRNSTEAWRRRHFNSAGYTERRGRPIGSGRHAHGRSTVFDSLWKIYFFFFYLGRL